MTDPAEILDDVLAGRRAPDPESAALVSALTALEPLRAAPERRPAAARAGLQAFLREAQAARGETAVSPTAQTRPTGWKLTLFRKELSPMNVILMLTLAVSMALGGAGATVYAAHDSLPNEVLYGVKLAAEDLRLGLSADSPAKLATLQDLTQARTQELLRLAEAGQAVPPSVTTRLQTQLQTELQLAAALDDAQLTATLAQVQTRLQTQLQMVEQARQAAPADAGLALAEQLLLQTRTLAQVGQTTPAQFRTQMQAGPGAPAGTPAAPRMPAHTPAAAGYGPGESACPTGACTPEYDGNSYGAGPGAAATPAGDQNSYGPGAAATPAGDQNSYGPGAAATPAGDQNSYGPGAATPAGDGAGSPGPVNPPAPEATCTPIGDQNNYGPGPTAGAPEPAGDGNGNGGNPPPTAPQPGKNQP